MPWHEGCTIQSMNRTSNVSLWRQMAALWLALACMASAHAGPVIDRIRQSGQIVLAHRDSSVPFSCLDGDGQPVGYAMDLCAKVVEPLAIMLSRDADEFKKVVDNEMKRLIATREAHAIFERWFSQPIPPKNKALNLPMNYLLKDFWKYPSDWVPG